MPVSDTVLPSSTKRRVLNKAAKMTLIQINRQINTLLTRYQIEQGGELALELECWADIWIRRTKE